MAPKKKKTDEEEYNLELRFGRVKNSLKMGIVGLPNVGKSSFFNLLTKQSVKAMNVPFCTIEPNLGRVKVPDNRFDTLCGMWKAPSEIPAFLNVTDIAGLVRGAHKGEGLGNEFLSNIMAVDGILQMVRIFENDEVTHVDECVDPVRDLETITGELCLKDLAYLDTVLNKATANAQKLKKKLTETFTNCFDKVRKHLEGNLILSRQEWSTAEVQLINEHAPQLITTKPMVYLLNMTTKGYLTKRSNWLGKVFKWVADHGGGKIVPFSVELEEELWEARKQVEDGSNEDAYRNCLKEISERIGTIKSKDPKDPTKQIEKTLNFDEKSKEEGGEGEIISQLNKIIKTGYDELNLIQFFTAGPQEVRSWTVYKGATAPNCAGVIHNDMEKCFIKAEVCAYDDYIANTPAEGKQAASYSGVKAAGKYRQEGKTYFVNDGDMLHIMHNAKK